MNSYQRIPLVLGVVVFTLVTVNSFVSAQDQKILRGLQGCRVVVVPLEPEIERDGLTTKQLQTDTELKLRMAGIKVFSLKEAARVKGSACFYLRVYVLKSRQGDYIYTIHVELKEWVLLMRNNDTSEAPPQTDELCL